MNKSAVSGHGCTTDSCAFVKKNRNHGQRCTTIAISCFLLRVYDKQLARINSGESGMQKLNNGVL